MGARLISHILLLAAFVVAFFGGAPWILATLLVGFWVLGPAIMFLAWLRRYVERQR